LKSGLTVRSPRHWLVALSAVFSDGSPAAVRHGELNDASVKPIVKFSFSLVVAIVFPSHVVVASQGDVGLTPMFVSADPARHLPAGRRTGRRWRACRMVLSHEPVGREQRLQPMTCE
jgi:hypothetical protein